MIRLMIIEDEAPALEKLKKAVLTYDSGIEIVATTGSVRDSVKWLNSHPHPDLILLDIRLSDGLSLEIFSQSPVNCPVIFTTAYDEYLLDAFAYNGIDYLLKPIKQQKLEAALNRYLKFRMHFRGNVSGLQGKIEGKPEKNHRQRMLVKKGIDFIPVEVGEIAYFFSQYKMVFMVDREGKQFVVDKTLSDLEEELNPTDFFRVNRKYLVQREAILRFHPAGKGKVAVVLSPTMEEEPIVSQERAGEFRGWMGN